MTKNSNLLKNVSPEQIRIILWDIDGTLMTSTVAGAYKEYFAASLEKVYGSSGKIDELYVSGMTDTQIAYEALKDEGFTPEKILSETPKLLKVFKEEMSRVITERNHPFKIFEGAKEIVEKTHQSPLFINALLSGNLSVAAEIKLRRVELWKYFKNVPHSFGEISHDRRQLAFEAGKSYNKFLKAEIKPEQFIVVGDTPNDIACARAFGAKAISVATGRNHSAESLANYNPDLLFDDLKQTEKVFRSLIEI